MKPIIYDSQQLKKFIVENIIVTVDEMSEALERPSRATLFRKLAVLNYRSSYSHNGKFYTLTSTPRFSSQGLWSYQGVHFSRFGNLLETCRHIVDQSEEGHTALELRVIVGVKTKHALLQLVRKGDLQRDETHRPCVYYAGNRKIARPQKKRRDVPVGQIKWMVSNPQLALDEAKAALLLFVSLLDEKQRRIYAGLESLKLGHGGDRHIADLLGLDSHTVARGRRELVGEDVVSKKIRRSGAGRKSVKKNA